MSEVHLPRSIDVWACECGRLMAASEWNREHIGPGCSGVATVHPHAQMIRGRYVLAEPTDEMVERED